jgi:hypothetical protein
MYPISVLALPPYHWELFRRISWAHYCLADRTRKRSFVFPKRRESGGFGPLEGCASPRGRSTCSRVHFTRRGPFLGSGDGPRYPGTVTVRSSASILFTSSRSAAGTDSPKPPHPATKSSPTCADCVAVPHQLYLFGRDGSHEKSLLSAYGAGQLPLERVAPWAFHTSEWRLAKRFLQCRADEGQRLSWQTLGPPLRQPQHHANGDYHGSAIRDQCNRHRLCK